MKTTAFAIALLMSGAAIAQTYDAGTADTTQDTTTQDVTTKDAMDHSTMDHSTTAQGTTTQSPTEEGVTVDSTTVQSTTTQSTTLATNMAPASGAIVQPSNANPERDARGIAVISAPAVVPAGWNGVSGNGMGGPLLDPASGESIDAADDSYPACSATVTDNCLQTYERGRD